ncbi:sterol desaturase [Novosphingobium fuchskuhlense]|uniref:Sterol desaturase n=1 Tax=Novosphingobium fuchskuhlense TaxID=1117702 RepID=A0A124JU28_9SPHN|nr:sterol desaturase family protein [Novosphingobium fuchskuhlense]KUR70802.1 sterol desaturase [Novosphingobium fuchskuhlense]
MSSGLKQMAVDCLAPATLAAVVAFWYFAPASVVDNPWTLLIVSSVVTVFVLGLELVFERHEGWRINRQELLTDLFYFILINTVIQRLASMLNEEPLRALKASWGIATPWAAELPFLAQVLLVWSVWEFGQYWMHRLMHNWEPFWLTHAPHHHITQLNAMKGAVGNPIELFLISLGVVALFDVSPATYLCAFSAGNVVSTFNHANVRSNPPLFYSFFFTSIRHHSYHHSVGYENTRCNYGNAIILFDRILGTYKEGEGVLVGQDDRRRLTIWEQFMFPFKPLVAMIERRRNGSSAAG